MNTKTKKLLIGLGLSGRAAARFFLDRGEPVVGYDRRLELATDPAVLPLIRDGLKFVFDEAAVDFAEMDQIILSPGVELSHALVKKGLERGIEVIGEIELALRHASGRPMIGITGTNGKTTTTLLIAHVLNETGRKAAALGNVGLPLISAIHEEGIAVIELSSYQIETIKQVKLDGGVILNISPDHLDRYKTMQNYAAAKFQIQELIKPGGLFVLEEKAAKDYPFLIRREVTRYKSDFASHLSAMGWKSHEIENIRAAFLLTERLGVNEESFLQALKTFKKPPHRIEFVKEVRGVRFWNDSKGTNLDATLRAVENMPGMTHLIAGGVDKGFPYTGWIAPFKGRVKTVHVIGEAADGIADTLSEHFCCIKAKSFLESVQGAFNLAQAGEDVLLSPGCASFDMFRDYADRGDQFKFLVERLS